MTTTPQPRNCFACANYKVRRGTALVLVLGLLALTLALCYSAMQGQAEAVNIQANSGRTASARMAAYSGMSAALASMTGNSWVGVGGTLAGQLDANCTYSVAFTTGDASLTVGNPSYGEYPFRVTLTSVGTAVDPTNANLQSKYKVTAVVQLVRRAIDLSNTPTTNWNYLNGFTVCQWNNRLTPHTVNMQLPIAIQGNMAILGTLALANQYPGDASARQDYLSGLNAMRLNSLPDYRPFNSTVTLAILSQNLGTWWELPNWLGVATNAVWPQFAGQSPPVTYPSGLTTYRLYAGGPAYSIPTLQTQYGSSTQNCTIGANPVTNPLGLYKSSGAFEFDDQVTFTGCVLADGSSDELWVGGNGVTLNGVTLPAVDGSAAVNQLPLAAVNHRFVIKDQSVSTVNGLVMAWGGFDVEAGHASTQMALTGRVFSDDFDVRGRNEWVRSIADWIVQDVAFQAQKLLPSGTPYFPIYMQAACGLNAQPLLSIQPPANVTYIWPNWDGVYTKAAADSGLRWNIVSWQDGN